MCFRLSAKRIETRRAGPITPEEFERFKEQMNIENKLADITAALVELEENSTFLGRLFSIEAGKWVDAVSLCKGLTQIKGKQKKLKEETVRVTWLDYPDVAHGNGYCLIIFFSEELYWSSVALYNKQWFLRKFVRRMSTKKEGLALTARTFPSIEVNEQYVRADA